MAVKVRLSVNIKNRQLIFERKIRLKIFEAAQETNIWRIPYNHEMYN